MDKIEQDGGNILVIGDLHGDYESYKKIKSKWKGNRKKSHLVLLGDYIDGYDRKTDGSLEILDDIACNLHKKNFHALLGNHESSKVRNEAICRNNKPLEPLFKNVIRKRYKGKLEPHFTRYKQLFLALPVYVCINNIFFSHGGPSYMKELNEYIDVVQFTWNSPMENYTTLDVDNFLNIHKLDYMIQGHTHVHEWTKFGKKQYLIAPHYDLKRYYMDIDLNEVKNYPRSNCLDNYVFEL